jgi:amino acid transporter
MPLFTKLNSKNFPMWAIGFNFVVGMLLFLPLPGWQNMVSFLVSAVVVSYAMGPIALLSLRREMPNDRRAFRLPMANISCLLAFYCCNLISYWTGWETLSKLAIAMCIGFAIFAIAYGRGKIAQHNLGLKSVFWIAPYLMGLVCISYFGSFGGKHLIPFGWDFAVIGLFSIVMLNLAVALRSSQTEVLLNAEQPA